eukprot:11170856-Prorocentrum_lima.AAC.1
MSSSSDAALRGAASATSLQASLQGSAVSSEASEDELIYSRSPLNKQDFPESGPDSFQGLQQW